MAEVVCDVYECTGIAVQYHESENVYGTLLLNLVKPYPHLVVNRNKVAEMTVFPIYAAHHAAPQFQKMSGKMRVFVADRFVGTLDTLLKGLRTVDLASKLGQCLARWKVTFKGGAYKPHTYPVPILDFAPFVSPNVCIPAVDPSVFDAGLLESLGLKEVGREDVVAPPLAIDTTSWPLDESLSHYACIAAEKYAHYNAPKLMITQDGDVVDSLKQQKLTLMRIIP